MLSYLIRRIMWTIPVVLFLSLVTFVLMRQLGGNQCQFLENGKAMPPEIRQNCERRYHLDWPFAWPFFASVFGDRAAGLSCSGLPFLYGCNKVALTTDLAVYGGLVAGDFGISMHNRRSVKVLIQETFPISFQLGVLSILLALLIGIPTGVIAALNRNSFFDYSSSFVAVLGLAIPNIVLGPLLILIFASTLDWFDIATWGAKPPFVLGLFPSSLGLEFWSHAVLPAVTLGTAFAATIARLTRSSLLQIIREDFIRTARAKGLGESRVVVGHALKNSLIPVVTILGPFFAALITGTFVVEKIFGLPGMGKHFVDSIFNRDYPVVMGVTLFYGVILILSNLLVDISYAWLDPRIRYD